MKYIMSPNPLFSIPQILFLFRNRTMNIFTSLWWLRVGYLMRISNQTTQCMVQWHKFERMQSWPTLDTIQTFALRDWGKTRKPCQKICCPVWDSNRALPTNESSVIPLHLTVWRFLVICPTEPTFVFKQIHLSLRKIHMCNCNSIRTTLTY
jgi:hypothetical protein